MSNVDNDQKIEDALSSEAALLQEIAERYKSLPIEQRVDALMFGLIRFESQQVESSIFLTAMFKTLAKVLPNFQEAFDQSIIEVNTDIENNYGKDSK